MWTLIVSDVYEAWFTGLEDTEKEAIVAKYLLLADQGPRLGRPHADTVNGSAHSNMKELRVQHSGRPYRIFFAFDPDRRAILLCGGDKTGDKRFYERMIPIADREFEKHLQARNEP